jgi:N-acetylglucosaminyldiphosphoundecaprenol N-acetyl-beta-D-mannosaminyltransferase
MSPRNAGAILGIPISRESLAELLDVALAAIDDAHPQVVFSCANPHSLVVAQKDLVFAAALRDSDFVIADGVGVTVMARIAGIRTGPRITGTDFFLGLMATLQRRGRGSVFFLGSSPEVLSRIEQRMRHEYPLLELRGILSPSYHHWSIEESDWMVTQINAAKPDVLWVGVTAPKQEKWVSANRLRLAVPVIASIGAVFDFFAGTYPRAPDWMCRLGIEWLYRLVREPRRLWRRTLVSTPRFIQLVLRWHVLGKGPGDS